MENKLYENKAERILTDTDVIQFGKYKGTQLANVPASYLLWLYDNGSGLRTNPSLRKYIEINMDCLVKEKSSNKYNH